MATVTISADWSTYQNTIMPGWWAIQNVWNEDGLVNGVNFTQSITCDTTNFPNGTVINWNWGSNINSTNVWGYPEVVYGYQNGTTWQSPDGHGPAPIQIKNLTVLTGSYNVTLGGDPNTYDILWENHLTNGVPGTNVIEFAIMVHTPPYMLNWLNNAASGFTKHPYTNGTFVGNIFTGSNGSTLYTLAVRNVESYADTFDLRAYYNWLITNGFLTGNEWLEGFEFGVEPQQGAGSLTINSLSYNWNTSTSNVSLTPAAATLALTATTPTIIFKVSLTPAAATLALTATTPAARQNNPDMPSVATLALTVATPILSVSSGVHVNLPAITIA